MDDPVGLATVISGAVVAVVLGVVGGLRALRNGKPQAGTEQRASGLPPAAVDPLADPGRHLAVGPMTGHELRAMAANIRQLASAAPATGADLEAVEKRIGKRIDVCSDAIGGIRETLSDRPCMKDPPGPCN